MPQTKEEKRAYRARWLEANLEREREKARQRSRKNRAENPEKVRAYQRFKSREFRANNPDYFKTEAMRRYKRDSARKHRAANPGRDRANRLLRTTDETRRIAAEKQRAYRASNPGRTRALSLRNKYSLSLGEFESMAAAQNRQCAICRQDFDMSYGVPKAWQPNVDHDHVTGRVRGLLCPSCNLMIGLANDDGERLIAAAEYLKQTQHPALMAVGGNLND